MYCPLCGNKMEEVGRDCDHIDYECPGGEDVYDDSIHWGCPVNKCFGYDYPLIQHYVHGFEKEKDKDGNLLLTAPGDSWSLTWIK
jgi:hypothetical protein